MMTSSDSPRADAPQIDQFIEKTALCGSTTPSPLPDDWPDGGIATDSIIARAAGLAWRRRRDIA